MAAFAEAVKTLHALVGVKASAASARRATEGAGAAYVAVQDEAVATLECKTPCAPIESHLRTQTALQRRRRCQQRRQAKEDRRFAAAMAPHLAAVPPAPAPTADQPPAADTAATATVKHRPAANHPWRHAPIGRARFRT